MCRECHSAFTDEDVVKQLKKIVDNPQYEKWNTTSISHIAIAASGENGDEARTLGLKLLRDYTQWRKSKPNDYMPEHGMETMFIVSDLNEIYERCFKKESLDDFKPTYELKKRTFTNRQRPVIESVLYGAAIGMILAGVFILAFGNK